MPSELQNPLTKGSLGEKGPGFVVKLRAFLCLKVCIITIQSQTAKAEQNIYRKKIQVLEQTLLFFVSLLTDGCQI